ncbi:hypothetical protein [Ancylobacter sp. G4_0304]|uniref:hypothetical protein n=1 Tax=Ancylobacter sp. G4_0304 TaxID=3114289 RepID=UPI0039C65DCD
MSKALPTLKAGIVLAALAGAMIAPMPAQAHNSTGALIGGLIGGAILGSAVTAATQPPRYYYPPPPPPVYVPPPAPVYGPGYCGAPPYPPCRTPVY